MSDDLANPLLDEFLRDLASGAPTPGGGAVAGLCGALGAALTSMVANLTIGKKKYAAVENEFKERLAPLETARYKLRQLMDDDARVFAAYMAAWKLPKGDDDAKAARKEAIRLATLDASEVPLRTLEACRDLLPAIRFAAESGNQNAVSDAGIAALLVTCGAKAAAMNVKINLAGLKGCDYAKTKDRLDELMAATLGEAKALEELVDRVLSS
ncbi:MAG: cyclodeaminase/cyclohydrolase family protein [Planctomycetota bacterium]